MFTDGGSPETETRGMKVNMTTRLQTLHIRINNTYMIMFNGGASFIRFPTSFLLLQCFILHVSLICLINLNVELFIFDILYIISIKYYNTFIKIIYLYVV